LQGGFLMIPGDHLCAGLAPPRIAGAVVHAMAQKIPRRFRARDFAGKF
jgi:hypothetical protein